MTDIIDIFTGETIEEPRSVHATQRILQCIERAEEIGYCDCSVCKDKRILANRMVKLVRYLCQDYTERTGKELYVVDAMDILATVMEKLKRDIK